MKAMTNETRSKVEELLRCLDGDIRNTELNLERLNELRSAVIKRDYNGLSRLLESIRQESSQHNRLKSDRQTARKELAESLGCEIEQVTLSRLEQYADGEMREYIRQRKSRLKRLTDEMKKEYALTVLLLSEFSRINRRFMRALFNNKIFETVSYDSSGTVRTNMANAFVNMKL